MTQDGTWCFLHKAFLGVRNKVNLHMHTPEGHNKTLYIVAQKYYQNYWSPKFSWMPHCEVIRAELLQKIFSSSTQKMSRPLKYKCGINTHTNEFFKEDWLVSKTKCTRQSTTILTPFHIHSWQGCVLTWRVGRRTCAIPHSLEANLSLSLPAVHWKDCCPQHLSSMKDKIHKWSFICTWLAHLKQSPTFFILYWKEQEFLPFWFSYFFFFKWR